MMKSFYCSFECTCGFKGSAFEMEKHFKQNWKMVHGVVIKNGHSTKGVNLS